MVTVATARPVDVLCTAEEFKSLRCPYTGNPLEVRMLVVPGQPPRFHAPGAYSPAERYPTPEDAYRMWNRVDGVEGLKTGRPITCAYTGAVLAAVRDREGCGFSGAFDPRMFWTREEFLRKATMRDGKGPAASADARIEASAPGMEPLKPLKPRRFDTDPTDEALHIAESVLAKHRDILPKQASTTVSMSVSPARGGKGVAKGAPKGAAKGGAKR